VSVVGNANEVESISDSAAPSGAGTGFVMLLSNIALDAALAVETKSIRGALRDFRTGTGFACAKLSEIHSLRELKLAPLRMTALAVRNQ
jgi:hypothetical protein